jgi:hypothetical protein
MYSLQFDLGMKKLFEKNVAIVDDLKNDRENVIKRKKAATLARLALMKGLTGAKCLEGDQGPPGYSTVRHNCYGHLNVPLRQVGRCCDLTKFLDVAFILRIPSANLQHRSFSFDKP